MKNELQLLHMLRLHRRLPSAELLRRLGVSRATLMRTIHSLGSAVVTRGQARRVTYAARRLLQGSDASLPLYRIDEAGAGSEIAQIDLLHPEGCAMSFSTLFEWPLIDEMRDGWFDGIPYPLEDMRPQGFLGRQFARRYADIVHTPEDPGEWREDDVFRALSLFGEDQPGNTILGEIAYRRFLSNLLQQSHFLGEAEVHDSYAAQAEQAMSDGVPGSSTGGEFPKFTARRLIDGERRHVIVKFSGADDSPGSRRWADLLVCEQIASHVLREQLGIDAAESRIYQASGRTFLEVVRFDRHGAHGRSPVCSWAAINGGLIGLAGRNWMEGAAALERAGLLSPKGVITIQRIWHFGRLIANTDMHDGNLSFRPGLTLAPVYDMLPMAYAPQRGVELRDRDYAPQLPLPAEQSAWGEAARAASIFWRQASNDERVSDQFRAICRSNAGKLEKLCASYPPR